MAETKKIHYTVSEAAKDVGVATSAIRFWDDEYGIIKTRTPKGNSRKITIKELMVLHKIKTLGKFMNKNGIKAVLDGDIQIKVNPEIL
jgi:DNA-binding transcriptional MerR regulator